MATVAWIIAVMFWKFTLNHRRLKQSRRDTHSEQGDVELGNGIERESGKDVNTGGNESEDIDGQLLDGDDDLGVEADKHLDVGIDIDLSLWMIIVREHFLKHDCLKETRTDFDEDRINSTVRLGDAVGDSLRSVTAGYDGLWSTSKYVCSHRRSVCNSLGHTCPIDRRAG